MEENVHLTREFAIQNCIKAANTGVIWQRLDPEARAETISTLTQYVEESVERAARGQRYDYELTNEIAAGNLLGALNTTAVYSALDPELQTAAINTAVGYVKAMPNKDLGANERAFH